MFHFTFRPNTIQQYTRDFAKKNLNTAQIAYVLVFISNENMCKQESIAVGCVLPAYQPYLFSRPPLGASTMGVGIFTLSGIPTPLWDTYPRVYLPSQ